MANPSTMQYSSERPERTSLDSLAFSPVHVRPHFNGHPDHPSSVADVEHMIKTHQVTEPVYLIDDESAVLVSGEEVRVLSEGEWRRFN